jgi:hypothetical protein
VRELRPLAAVAIAAAVSALWVTLYGSLPAYPPSLELPLAVTAILFLTALILLHRMHTPAWPGIAQFGFIVSAIGLVLWIVGGTLNALGQRLTDVIARPQIGWGLFCVGLMPIGVGAIRSRLSVWMRLLLPLGGLFLVGEPLKYLLGERTGGLTVLVAFGVGWLVIGLLLVVESHLQRKPELRLHRSSDGVTTQ